MKEKTNTTWEKILSENQFTLNATLHKTLNMSPVEIILERKIDRTRWVANKDKSSDRTSNCRHNYQESVLTKNKFKIIDRLLVKKEERNKDKERNEAPYTKTKTSMKRVMKSKMKKTVGL